MSRQPDLTNDKQDLAVWLNETEDGEVKISIYKNGDKVGTVIDFNKELLFRDKTKWFTYIIQCEPKLHSDKSSTAYYTGKTHDLQKRFKEHMEGVGSNWMHNNGYKPMKVIYWEIFDTEQEALDREDTIKSWSHDKKKRKGQKFINRNFEYINSKLSAKPADLNGESISKKQLENL